MHLKKTLSLILGTITVIGLTACGGGGDGGNMVVARVSGVGAITKATLDHWTRVEAVVLHELVPTRPAPEGVVPDPPEYTACISYLAATSGREKAAVSSHVELKTRCRRHEQELRLLTLNKLIAWEWTIGRGAALGMRADGAEVRQRLTEVVNSHATYGPDFGRYLKLTGQTMADMLFRSRVQLFEAKQTGKLRAYEQGLPKSLSETQRQAALVKFTTNLLATKKWVGETSCQAGYVVSACKQYHGSEQAPGFAD